MKPNYTHISIVLDRSGSMASIKNDTIGGFNTFLEKQKQTPGEATISLSQFDNDYEPLLAMKPIAEAKPLDTTTFLPRGSTALYGAVGRLIDETGQALAKMSEDQRPSKVVFVIITDGQENDSFRNEWSRQYTREKVKAMVETQTNNYKWEFVYVGENAIFNAQSIGVVAGKALDYTSNAAGTRVLYSSLADNVTSFRCAAKADMTWEDEDRKKQEEAK